MIGKVCIFEKDFPAGIPEDIGDSTLQVVNEKEETVALFICPSIAVEKFTKPMDFIRSYDNMIDLIPAYEIWNQECDENGPGSGSPGIKIEGAKLESEMDRLINDTNFGTLPISLFYGTELGVKAYTMALGRLAYPYHLHRKNMFSLNYFWGRDLKDLLNDISDYDDPRLNAMCVHQEIGSLPSIYQEGYIMYVYEYPEIFISQGNIDSSINAAIDANITDLTAFLLDYKNKYFQGDGNASNNLDL